MVLMRQLLLVFLPALVIFLAVAVYNVVCFQVLRRYAVRLSHGRRRDRARRLLEVLVWLPGPTTAKMLARYQLGIVYFLEQRMEDAETQFRELLDCPLRAGMAADVGRRLADVLDAQGRAGESERERGRATEEAARGSDAAALLAQGDLLERSHRYMDAFAAYEEALNAARTLSGATQAEIMVKMGLVAFHGSRPDLTIAWMEKAIVGKPNNIYLRQAHSLAGIAYGNQAQFARAIAHGYQAAVLAERDGATVEAGRALSMVASHQKNQGNVAQALATCEEITRRGWINRTFFFTKSECLEAVGQFEDAYQTALQARRYEEPGEPNIPHYRRRQEGVVSLGLARLLVLLDKPQEAWERLQEAVVAFQGDDKLSLWCDATAAWVLALLGRREQSEAKIRAVEAGMERYAEDRSGRLGCLYSLGRTQYALGDFEAAASRWQMYLEAGPNPVWQPRGYFFLGESLRHLGDDAGAREAYQQAICVPVEAPLPASEAWPPAPLLAPDLAPSRFVETYEAALARQRLEEWARG